MISYLSILLGNDIVEIVSESLAKIRPLVRLFFLLLFSSVACDQFLPHATVFTLCMMLCSSGEVDQLSKEVCFTSLSIITQ